MPHVMIAAVFLMLPRQEILKYAIKPSKKADREGPGSCDQCNTKKKMMELF